MSGWFKQRIIWTLVPFNEFIAKITLSKAITNIENSDPDSIWLAEGGGARGEFIYANGAKVVNSTHFYPTLLQ